ncbi:MAG: radical SAM protein [Dehalococcoidia bacterium]|nr:radical SAM protein [Dehalococcoidia bacterium]
MIKHLQLETTNVCNGHCLFCPHGRLKKFGTITDELYRKILEDAAAYNLVSFSPILTGEPFCDPQIVARIKLARALMPNTVIHLFTNGSLMSRDDIDELASIEGLAINISLNGQDRSRRWEMTGLDDFDEVLHKIVYLEEKRVNFGVSAVMHPVYTVEQAREFVRLPAAGFIRFQSFAGHIYPYNRLGPTCCRRITEYLTVMWDGRVNLCCFDSFGEIIFGDLNIQTIAEVWNSGKHRAYLEAHNDKRGQEMELCKYCTEGA